MSTGPTVTAVCGSVRSGSYTKTALEAALDGAESVGGSTDLIDLGAFDLPPLDPSGPGISDADDLRHRIRAADSILLGTPVYHGSFSGVLKNAIDYCGFDEFEHKTVGLLAVAGGRFPISALDHLRSVCRSLNAWVLPYQAAVPRSRVAFDGSNFIDTDLESRVRTLGERAVLYANIEPDPDCFESRENVGAD